MPLSDEQEQKFDEEFVALTDLYRAKQIDANSYHKCLVCLAYEYSVLGEHLRAAAIVQGIPMEYYRDVQSRQMLEDADFSAVSYTLAINLFQQGFVYLGGPLKPTQPPANA